MQFKNVSNQDMSKALNIINKKYDGNIEFNRFEQKGNIIFATLKVKNANTKHGTVKGRKLNQSFMMYKKGIRSNGSACWHVHGDFFETLLKVQPKAIIQTAFSNVYKDNNGVIVGNWQDKNIGSIMHPVNYSECCECNDKSETLKTAQIKTVKQNNLSSECWMVQIYGASYCETCEYKNTRDCGGKNILKTGKNAKGLNIPIA